MRGGAVIAARVAMKKSTSRRMKVDDGPAIDPNAIDWFLGCCSGAAPVFDSSEGVIHYEKILLAQKCGRLRWCSSAVANAFRIIAFHAVFNGFVTVVIFVAALLVGINTYAISNEPAILVLFALDELVMGVFIAEVVVKIFAEGKQPWRYFITCKSPIRRCIRNQTKPCWGGKLRICCCCCCVDPNVPLHVVTHESEANHALEDLLLQDGKWKELVQPNWWNLFDFTIVAVGLLPFSGSMVTALRLIRLLRVLKLVRALPKLRILVLGLIKSLSSIVYIGMLLGLLFYLYAVIGTTLFGPNDPHHMGSLHLATLTLFRCATLEDWTDIMYIAWYGCAEYGYGGMEDECVDSKGQPVLSIAYHCSFVVVSSMMILNLFIGVITSSMNEAKNDLEEEMRENARSNPANASAIDPVDDIEDDVIKVMHGDGGFEELRQEIEAFALRERQIHAEMSTVSMLPRDAMVAPEGETLDFRELKPGAGEGKKQMGVVMSIVKGVFLWLVRSSYTDTVVVRNGKTVEYDDDGAPLDAAPHSMWCIEEIVVTKAIFSKDAVVVADPSSSSSSSTKSGAAVVEADAEDATDATTSSTISSSSSSSSMMVKGLTDSDAAPAI